MCSTGAAEADFEWLLPCSAAARSTRAFDLVEDLSSDVIRLPRGQAREDPASGFARRIGRNVSFEELCALLRYLGFDERIRASHHIFTKEGIERF